MSRPHPASTLLVLALAPACTTTPQVAIPGERGDVTITTWTDGAVAGGVGVYVHDDAGEVRGHFESDARGVLVVAVAPGWSATVIDDLDGFRYVDTALGLVPGDAVAIGQRRRLSGEAPPLRVAALAPIDGATRYAITVCGPLTTTSPVDDPTRETMATYDRRALDDDGGALIVAEAFGLDDAPRFALVDADDVTKLASPVALPAWREITTAPVFVAADPEALEVAVSLRSHHGCVVGAGTSAGGDVPVAHYPGLPIERAAATTWFRRDARQTSWTSRRVAVQTDKPAPTALVADVPARVDDVAVQPYGSGTVVGWSESGDPLAGDGVVVVAGPTYDAQWTMVMPRGRRSVILPRLSEVPAGAPQWINVSIVDLDEVDDWSELTAPRWDQAGWTATGTLANPVE